MVHRTTHQQLPNTKTETGKMLETWLKLDMLMVQSPQDQSQWLLVVIHIVEQRKCICQRDNSIIINYNYIYKYYIFSTNTELWNFDTLESQIIDPTLSRNYSYGIGLFLVDAKYCAKN